MNEDNDPTWYFNNAILHINFCLEVEKKYKRVHYSELKNRLAINLFTLSLKHERYEFIIALKKYPELIQHIIDIMKQDPNNNLQELITALQ